MPQERDNDLRTLRDQLHEAAKRGEEKECCDLLERINNKNFFFESKQYPYLVESLVEQDKRPKIDDNTTIKSMRFVASEEMMYVTEITLLYSQNEMKMVALFYYPYIGYYDVRQIIFSEGYNSETEMWGTRPLPENRKKEIDATICNQALDVNDFEVAEFLIKGRAFAMPGDPTLVESLNKGNKVKWEKYSCKKPTSYTSNQFCGANFAKCAPCVIL